MTDSHLPILQDLRINLLRQVGKIVMQVLCEGGARGRNLQLLAVAHQQRRALLPGQEMLAEIGKLLRVRHSQVATFQVSCNLAANTDFEMPPIVAHLPVCVDLLNDPLPVLTGKCNHWVIQAVTSCPVTSCPVQ